MFIDALIFKRREFNTFIGRYHWAAKCCRRLATDGDWAVVTRLGLVVETSGPNFQRYTAQ
ncbi:hypothetical protein TUM4438_35070 [Shewanella sairae]|uniref:Uncharacterized protein n=1 Tax=Shewanella sairae TaxID=190310 RepID=A0ABQ4PNP0_9GAMM|nr:hypothetical protein TUM4438_35070 [Shewanella sairae]